MRNSVNFRWHQAAKLRFAAWLTIACLLAGSARWAGGQSTDVQTVPANVTATAGQAGMAPSQYVRIALDDQSQPLALQTSITSFENPDRTIVVDLVGAIHIGEKAYYAKLNRLFREYDAVLYELVAPEGTRVPKGGADTDSAVSYLQNGMTQALNLAFQLEQVDYTVPNFVHADMTPDEFVASMKARKESLGKMFFRMVGQSIAQQSRPDQGLSDLKVLAALMSDHRELELRRALSTQFADMDGATLAFSGPDGSTLITERNKKALRVLRSELDQGKKKIAVFFGAGHMHDMAERLARDFEVKHAGTRWLDAWDLSQPETEER